MRWVLRERALASASRPEFWIQFADRFSDKSVEFVHSADPRSCAPDADWIRLGQARLGRCGLAPELLMPLIARLRY